MDPNNTPHGGSAGPVFLPPEASGDLEAAFSDESATGKGRGRRVFRNTVLNGASVVFTISVAFVLTPFFIDQLGVAAYGVWVLALTFSITGGYLSLSDLGLHEGIVKFVAEAEAVGDHARIGRIVSSGLAVFCGVGAVATTGVVIFGLVATGLFQVPQELQPALRLLLILLAAEAAVGLPGLAFLGVLQGLQRYPVIRGIDFSRQLVHTAIAVIAIANGGGVGSIGVAAVVSTSLSSVAYFIAARRAIPGLRISHRSVSRAELRQLAHFSGWVFLGKAMSLVWRHMDKVILASLFATALLTSYDVANKIQATAAVFIAFTSSAILPAASSLAATGETARLQELMTRGTRYTLALALPVILGSWVMAGPFLTEWVGPQFASLAPATRMFLAYQLLVSLASISLSVLLGLGRTRSLALLGSASAVINLGLSLMLAPHYGIRGVIAGTLVGYGLAAPVYIGLALKATDLRLQRFLAETVFPLFPAGAAFFVAAEATRRLFDPSSITAVIAACLPALALYMLVVGFIVFSRDERKMLRGFVR